MKTSFAIFIILSCNVLYAQEKLVSVNGHKFGVYLKGFETRKKNAPVVVFENGMGVDLGSWNTVIDEISKSAPVVAYNRSGVGNSDKVFQMPTIKVVAENLRALLSSLNIPPPYVLVGHSMGGVYVRAFAGFYPNDVVGVIMVDPADFTESKDDWNSIFREIGVPDKRIDEMMYERLYTPVTIDSVHYGPWSEGQVLSELRRTDFAAIQKLSMPNVPVYFLVGGKFEVPADYQSKDFDHPRFFIVKTNRNIERWRAFLDSSSKQGLLIYLPNCGHYVHRDDPKAVINSIKYMLNSL